MGHTYLILLTYLLSQPSVAQEVPRTLDEISCPDISIDSIQTSDTDEAYSSSVKSLLSSQDAIDVEDNTGMLWHSGIKPRSQIPMASTNGFAAAIGPVLDELDAASVYVAPRCTDKGVGILVYAQRSDYVGPVLQDIAWRPMLKFRVMMRNLRADLAVKWIRIEKNGKEIILGESDTVLFIDRN